MGDQVRQRSCNWNLWTTGLAGRRVWLDAETGWTPRVAGRREWLFTSYASRRLATHGVQPELPGKREVISGVDF
jgi:hypothetical protein